MQFRLTAALPILLALIAPATASSTSWMESDGAAIRIVSSGLSDEKGALRGAVEIRLKPGWKTYWRAPGEAGVPPEIELAPTSDARSAELFFPAPERISDAYASWAGYKHPVSLPVIFDFPKAGTAGIIEGKIFLGVCETVCIPVELPFSFDAGTDPDNAGDAIAVAAAFAALPGPAREDFGVSEVLRERSHMEFHVKLPPDTQHPALFVAPPAQVQITMPKLQERQETSAIFTAKSLGDPALFKEPLTIEYTLVSGGKAVAGQIALP
ncbi:MULTISPECIES: protein-disulfide reductase DsbD domain-containing protein [Chelativorans]|jgi:DsbC/DsbD-like thiol-disulfide interchange protein|uniref:Thiol:disulfide interchange protein DsbD N-terminal domain-containing protein n=1 Tax=Chelativorans sp. (strain BNC1) TaxID=266779 RepID=Q11KC3_CHESB|nr:MULTISPECIES: protein-disulfide reductase DsbD domain-containing protein [Chelativorans]